VDGSGDLELSEIPTQVFQVWEQALYESKPADGRITNGDPDYLDPAGGDNEVGAVLGYTRYGSYGTTTYATSGDIDNKEAYVLHVPRDVVSKTMNASSSGGQRLGHAMSMSKGMRP
jgi:hypothetical protein